MSTWAYPVLRPENVQQPDVLGQMGKMLALRQAMAMQPLQIAEAQNQLAMQNMNLQSERALMQAFQQSGGDMEKTIDAASASGAVLPERIIKLREDHIAYMDKLVNMQQTQRNVLADQNAELRDKLDQAKEQAAGLPPDQQLVPFNNALNDVRGDPQAQLKYGVNPTQLPSAFTSIDQVNLLENSLSGQSKALADAEKRAQQKETTARAAQLQQQHGPISPDQFTQLNNMLRSTAVQAGLDPGTYQMQPSYDGKPVTLDDYERIQKNLHETAVSKIMQTQQAMGNYLRGTQILQQAAPELFTPGAGGQMPWLPPAPGQPQQAVPVPQAQPGLPQAQGNLLPIPPVVQSPLLDRQKPLTDQDIAAMTPEQRQQAGILNYQQGAPQAPAAGAGMPPSAMPRGPLAYAGGPVPSQAIQQPQAPPSRSGLPTGEAYIQTLPPIMQNQTRSIITGAIPFPSALRGGGAEMRARALTADPTANEQRYDLRQEYTKDASKGDINDINTALGHAYDLGTAIEALHNGDLPFLNKLANKYNVQTGGTIVTTFNTIADKLSSEVAAAYVRGGGTGAERITGAEHFSSDLGDAQLKSNLATTVQLLRSKIDSKENTWNQNFPQWLQQAYPEDNLNFESRFLNMNAQRALNKWAPVSRGGGGGAAGAAAPAGGAASLNVGGTIKIGDKRYRYNGGDKSKMESYTEIPSAQ